MERERERARERERDLNIDRYIAIHIAIGRH